MNSHLSHLRLGLPGLLFLATAHAADCPPPPGPHAGLYASSVRWVVAGSDGADADGSLEHPFSSPEQGLSRILPGEELRISGGAWPRIVIGRGGTPESPIFLTGDPDNPPVVGEMEVRADH